MQGSDGYTGEMATNAVVRAVAAERERCAKIAESIGLVHIAPADELELGYHEAAVRIAEAIRKSE